MQQANLVQLAKTGSAQAIAALIARQLQPKGVRVQADLSPDRLHLRFESIQPLDANQLLPWLYRGLKTLNPKGIDRVALSGWRPGAEEPDWQRQIRLSQPLPPPPPPRMPADSEQPLAAPHQDALLASDAQLEPPPPPPKPPAPLSPPFILSLVGTLIFALLLYQQTNLHITVTAALLGLAVATVAHRKQRRPGIWFCYGFVVFPVAIFHVAALGRVSWYGVALFFLGIPLASALANAIGAEQVLLLALLAVIPASLARNLGRDFFLWYLYSLGALFLAMVHAVLLYNRQLPQFAGQNCHDRDFSGQDLSGADFTGAGLQGANFQGATLVQANFRQANLQGANLSEANLWGADFHTADLTAADLTAAKAHWQIWLEQPPRWLLFGAAAVALQVIAGYFLAPILFTVAAYSLIFVAAALFGLVAIGRDNANNVTAALVSFSVLGGLVTVARFLSTLIRIPVFLSWIFPTLPLAIAGIAIGTVFAIQAFKQRRWSLFGLWLGVLGGLIAIPVLTATSIVGPLARFGGLGRPLSFGMLTLMAATGALVGWLVGLGFARRHLCFRQANLRHANLTGAHLQNADFRRAIATGINLTDADLRGALAPDGNAFRPHR